MYCRELAAINAYKAQLKHEIALLEKLCNTSLT